MERRIGELFLSYFRKCRCCLKLPDAIQLAVALDEGCFALVTHDRDFSAVKDVLILGASPRRR